MNDPQLLVIPLGLLLYLVRKPLRGGLKRLTLPVAYVLLGTVLGLLVESFAILNYLHDPKNSHLFSIAPILWLYVSVVYAVFTWGPYATLQERFSDRRPARWWAYPLLLAAMWAAAFVGAIIGTGLSKAVGG